MVGDYYGIQILSVALSDRWKWQVILPVGVSVTSIDNYDTPEQALYHGRCWVSAETAFYALDHCLSELCHKGSIHTLEYQSLIQSLLQITQRCF
ncbi:MAG: hypothetical protein IGS48_11305 [Oscillatoriales cyanobacterium C42_A2020_001]|nr:hypothetical protein [Leptolyngbyaceae cyanobacterium C42_A2020_001]